MGGKEMNGLRKNLFFVAPKIFKNWHILIQNKLWKIMDNYYIKSYGNLVILEGHHGPFKIKCLL